MRDIRKVTCGGLFTKQAMRKEIVLFTESTYILKLLLNIVTDRTEVPIISENKFLYAFVKEACHL
jgi:hypothetical protein